VLGEVLLMPVDRVREEPLGKGTYFVRLTLCVRERRDTFTAWGFKIWEARTTN